MESYRLQSLYPFSTACHMNGLQPHSLLMLFVQMETD